MKNLLFTLAILVSFGSFGQNKDSSLLNLPQASLALKDYNEKEGVYQVSKNEISNIFNKLYIKSNIVKGEKYLIGWKDKERKIPRVVIGDDIEYYQDFPIRIELPVGTWDVDDLANPHKGLIKALNNLKKGDLIVIDNAYVRIMGSSYLGLPRAQGVIINVTD